MNRGKKIFFLDECVFSVNAYQKRDWSRVNDNVTVAAKQYNITCYAFLGAIGMDRGMVHFDLYKRSVDRWKFIDWLHTFKRKIGREGCYLYMDNLQVHKTEEVSEVL